MDGIYTYVVHVHYIYQSSRFNCTIFLCTQLLKKQNPFWSNFIKLATVSERQALPIHVILGLAWIGGACLSETVAS